MIALFKKIISPFLIAWGRTPVLWIWRKPKDDLDFVLLTASRHFNRKWNHERFRYVSLTMYFFMLLIWPLRAIAIIVKGMVLHGAKAKRIHNLSYGRQIIDQLKIAFLYWSNPEIYYVFELFEPHRIKQARHYLLENHMSALLGFINDHKSDAHIENKVIYNQTMRAKGFPMVHDIAIADQGKIVDSEGVATKLPDSDFFMKPTHGIEGQRVQRFEKLADGSYRSSSNKIYDVNALHRYVEDLSKVEGFLIQPRLLNHPDIADLTNKSFGTCRIITGRHADGRIDIVLALLKMPTGRGVADNYAAGGIASPINADTGTLGKASAREILSKPFTHHPDTGAVIENRILPFWPEVVALVKSAHAHTEGNFLTLGWDIGICQDGPVILETQVTWGFILAQKPGMRPLGSTILPALCQEWAANRGAYTLQKTEQQLV